MTGRGQVARVVLAALVGGLLAASIGPAPAGAARRVGGTAGPAADPPVGVVTRTFFDRDRRTPADPPAGIAPSGSRRLRTTIYYPARGRAGSAGTAAVAGAKPAAGPFPLVLFGPGSPGTPADYEVLVADWARRGYVVAAIEFPVSSVTGPDEVAWADLPAQTKDAVFVLDRVLALDPDRAGVPEIDEARIAVAGHSFGGATALSLVSRCCRDDRVDAAVILAGVTETEAGPPLRAARGPVLFVHARFDPSVPYLPAVEACASASSPRRLLTVETIRGRRAHVDPYLGAGVSAAVVRPAIVDFLDGYVRDRPAARARLDRAGQGTAVGTVTRCRPGEVPTAPAPA